MGEVAEMMINGTLCHFCGVYLEPEEKGFLVHAEGKEKETKMPDDGSPFGVPVECLFCFDDSDG